LPETRAVDGLFLQVESRSAEFQDSGSMPPSGALPAGGWLGKRVYRLALGTISSFPSFSEVVKQFMAATESDHPVTITKSSTILL
jgi:hypothetical protein